MSSENQYVKMGAFHTLDLEAGRDFTLIKQPGGWDSIGLERVNESTAVAGGAEVGAIVCGEGKVDCVLIARRACLTVPLQRCRKCVLDHTTYNNSATADRGRHSKKTERWRNSSGSRKSEFWARLHLSRAD